MDSIPRASVGCTICGIAKGLNYCKTFEYYRVNLEVLIVLQNMGCKGFSSSSGSQYAKVWWQYDLHTSQRA